MSQAKQRYRLVFWGPGQVGSATLREALKHPEFEVVGAKVFNPEKHGRDIGELVGMAPIGVKATTNAQEIFDLKADCVIHASQAFDLASMTDDVVRLLESGKNVVSVAGFHYPLMRGSDYSERLRQACLRGNSTLMGAGINPGFISGSFLLPLTACMTKVEHIRLIESTDLRKVFASMGAAANMLVGAMGFGVDPAAAVEPYSVLNAEGPAAQMLDHYHLETAGFLAKRLFNADPEQIRVKAEVKGIAGEQDFAYSMLEHGKKFELNIKKGLTQKVVRIQRFYIGDYHFFTNENHWFVGPRNRTPSHREMPFQGAEDSIVYAVEIKGEPNTAKLQFAIDEPAGEGAIPCCTSISVATLLQSVVPVCHAAPGFFAREFASHYATDLRTLA